MSAVSTIRSMAPAVIVSLLPKTAGSIARIGDDRYAPKNVRRGTIVREGTTLAQVAVYAAAIERSVRFMKNQARQMIWNGEKNLFTSAMQKLEKSEPLFLAGLAFTSNITAEMISRKLSPRNVWKQPDVTGAKDKPAIQATLVDEAQGKQIPVEIEICKVSPAKSRKETPRPECAAKTQPLQFTSRPALPAPSPAVNPFRMSGPFSPVARPAFQV